MIVTVLAGSQTSHLPLCVAYHLHMWLRVASPPRRSSATSCSCLRPHCYSSADACGGAHQLAEDRCNLDQTQKKRSQTAPEKVQRKEWVCGRVLIIEYCDPQLCCNKNKYQPEEEICVNVFFIINLCSQSPVRPLKEEESSLWVSPEKQYPDDFEPYESEDMEVESRHGSAFVCVRVRVPVRACGCIWARGGAMCQMQLSVLFSISPSPSLRLHRDFPLIQTLCFHTELQSTLSS